MKSLWIYLCNALFFFEDKDPIKYQKLAPIRCKIIYSSFSNNIEVEKLKITIIFIQFQDLTFLKFKIADEIEKISTKGIVCVQRDTIVLEIRNVKNSFLHLVRLLNTISSMMTKCKIINLRMIFQRRWTKETLNLPMFNSTKY